MPPSSAAADPVFLPFPISNRGLPYGPRSKQNDWHRPFSRQGHAALEGERSTETDDSRPMPCPPCFEKWSKIHGESGKQSKPFSRPTLWARFWFKTCKASDGNSLFAEPRQILRSGLSLCERELSPRRSGRRWTSIFSLRRAVAQKAGRRAAPKPGPKMGPENGTGFGPDPMLSFKVRIGGTNSDPTLGTLFGLSFGPSFRPKHRNRNWL